MQGQALEVDRSVLAPGLDPTRDDYGRLQITLEVRCGECRRGSMRSRGDQRADYLGYLHVRILAPELWHYDWDPRPSERERRTRRKAGGFLPNDGDSSDVTIKTRCRHRHDLRVGERRVRAAIIDAVQRDGIVWLTS